MVPSGATTVQDAPTSTAKATSKHQRYTSNPTQSKPTAPRSQYQYHHHPPPTHDQAHHTPAPAPAPTRSTEPTIPSSKNPKKQRTKALRPPPPSPPRHLWPTKSSRPIETHLAHATNAHSPVAPRHPPCVRSASKSTRRKIPDT